MICPFCKTGTFIELETWEPDYMGCGWSVKKCMKCNYEVQDKTMDGRFAGVDYVIRQPDKKALRGK